MYVFGLHLVLGHEQVKFSGVIIISPSSMLCYASVGKVKPVPLEFDALIRL